VTRKILAVCGAVLAFGGTVEAQQSRPELVRAAVTAADDFAPERALELVKVALNPALGPVDTSWNRGVHLLTQLLVEGNNQDLARTWSRWAMRLSPTMPIDSVNYVAGVAGTLRDARTAASVRTPGDGVTQTSWIWVGRGSSEANGRISITQGAIPVPVNVRIVGGGLIPAGGLSLPPGSYEVEAAAPGYLPARVTREVLPGVTTTLAFALTSAAVASDVIADNVRQRAFANLATLQVSRFATAPGCAVGAYVSRDGLIVTSYRAVRGADNVTVGGAPARIAAYDVASDLAVLQTTTTRTDSIPIAASIADGQSAWGFRLADCRTPSETRTRVNLWTDRPRGALQLSGAPVGATVGSPLIDVNGRLSGVWGDESRAVPAPAIASLITAARRAITANTVQSAADVARKENHTYGSVAIGADLPGTSLRVSPLETWQWESLRAAGAAPLTFIGPMGRYRVEATAPGGATRQQEFTIRPGATERLMVTLRQVAGAPGAGTPTVAKKKSKLPWILGGVGVAGAGIALALGGGSSPPPTTGPNIGSINISIPNP
jgi:hypothetical protein